MQGKCCGPYHLTFGAKPGVGSQECGVYLYSEIQRVSELKYYYDKTTQTAIGYLRYNSSDEWTEGGTWFSYNDQNSVQAITQFISKSSSTYAVIRCPLPKGHSFINQRGIASKMGVVY